MKKYLILLIFIGLSSCIDAQTVKETVRGKYGENLGTVETTIRGGKSVTVYKDKFGQITGTSESRTGAFGKTTTVYKDKYGQKTGTSTSTTSHGLFSSRTTSTTYRDKYVTTFVGGKISDKISLYGYIRYLFSGQKYYLYFKTPNFGQKNYHSDLQ